MADLHKAIRTIHNNTVSINGDTQETITAWDKDGNEISINWTDVNAWIDPEQYKYDRANEYPSIVDQLDYIYHNGVTKWKTDMITPIKEKYPKPE